MEYPRHLTIIMDGNGRWAKQQGKQRLFGHNAGTESVRQCCEYAVEHKIEYLSLFTFSEENWNRPKEEVDGLMVLMAKQLEQELPTLIENNMKFSVIGNLERLSKSLREMIEYTEKKTEGNTGTNLILMLSYSGKWDILQAARKYASDCVAAGKVIDTDESCFARYLSTAGIPEPDLMIRTSGEERISNYMLWQCAYTEFYFTSVLWPDFGKKDLDLAIEDFNRRQRRYGEVK